MKVILLQDIKGVGKKDQVIEAADGYARNFLFPRKMALEANAGNMGKLNAKKEVIQRKKDKEKEEAKEIAKRFKEINLEIKVKSGQNGRIFGGVTSSQIAENLEKQYSMHIDKKKIMLDNSIKNLGVVDVKVKLYEGVVGTLKVKISSI
ncbi:MAG: 50S ribosomal protein L9 [Clostridia bacterium]|nr:50S ribosomal protein L9 [Clostridia bacterium]